LPPLNIRPYCVINVYVIIIIVVIMLTTRGLHGPTFFAPAQPSPSSYGPGPAWQVEDGPGLACLQSTLDTVSLQEESGETAETETHQKNLNIIYTHEKCNCQNI